MMTISLLSLSLRLSLSRSVIFLLSLANVGCSGRSSYGLIGDQTAPSRSSPAEYPRFLSFSSFFFFGPAGVKSNFFK